ncbi:hypothetical protein CEXT_193291 [Caerostris extrusa]|uniref:Uncharacterized protein n=1 Tax=Caerostris extrusa TaxID=172846 RepID=A0AAV4NV92_CAEEX|nr:hypothetical protein CEXT_193291 [Caerostris extrusa]
MNNSADHLSKKNAIQNFDRIPYADCEALFPGLAFSFPPCVHYVFHSGFHLAFSAVTEVTTRTTGSSFFPFYSLVFVTSLICIKYSKHRFFSIFCHLRGRIRFSKGPR